MKKRYVLADTALPSRLPIWSATTAWLLLDRLDAPGYVWGIVGTVFALGLIGIIVHMIIDEKIDPFNKMDAEGDTTKAHSRWKKRLEEMQNKN